MADALTGLPPLPVWTAPAFARGGRLGRRRMGTAPAGPNQFDCPCSSVGRASACKRKVAGSIRCLGHQLFKVAARLSGSTGPG